MMNQLSHLKKYGMSKNISYLKPETVCRCLNWTNSPAAMEGGLSSSTGLSFRKNLPLSNDWKCSILLVVNSCPFMQEV